jgi:putative sigma-54 modulation protein
MKIDFNFKHVDISEALKEHAIDRIGRLAVFEHRPMFVHVVVSAERHECYVEIRAKEGRRDFKATAVSDDFYSSVDLCVDKLERQVAKKKRQVRAHRRGSNVLELNAPFYGERLFAGEPMEDNEPLVELPVGRTVARKVA